MTKKRRNTNDPRIALAKQTVAALRAIEKLNHVRSEAELLAASGNLDRSFRLVWRRLEECRAVAMVLIAHASIRIARKKPRR